MLRFNALTDAAPEDVARLIMAAGQNKSEEEPCVPLAARRLRLAQAAP